MSSSIFQSAENQRGDKMINLPESVKTADDLGELEATKFSDIQNAETFNVIDVDLINKGASFLNHQFPNPIKESAKNNEAVLDDIDLRKINTNASYLDSQELPDDFRGTPKTPEEPIKLEPTDSEELLVHKNFRDVGEHYQEPLKIINEDPILISDDEDSKETEKKIESPKPVSLVRDMKIQIIDLENGIKTNQQISNEKLTSAVEKHRLASESSSINSITDIFKNDEIFAKAKKAMDFINIKSNAKSYALEHKSPQKFSSPGKRKLEAEEDKENNNCLAKCTKSEIKKIEKPVKKSLIVDQPSTSNPMKSFDLLSKIQIDNKVVKDFSTDDFVIELKNDDDSNLIENTNLDPIKRLTKFVINYHDFSYIPHFIEMEKDLKDVDRSLITARAHRVIHKSSSEYERSDSVYVNEPPDSEFHPAIVFQSIDSCPMPISENAKNDKINILQDMVILPDKDTTNNASFNVQEFLNGILNYQKFRRENITFAEPSEPLNIDIQTYGDAMKKMQQKMPDSYLRKDPRLKHLNQKKIDALLPSNPILNNLLSQPSTSGLNLKRHSSPSSAPKSSLKASLNDSPVLLRKRSTENQDKSNGKWKKSPTHPQTEKPYNKPNNSNNGFNNNYIDINRPSTSKLNDLIRPLAPGSIKEFSPIDSPKSASLMSPPSMRSPVYNFDQKLSPEHKPRSSRETADDVDLISRHIAYYIYMFENISINGQNRFRHETKNILYQSEILREELRQHRKFFRDRNLKQCTTLMKEIERLNIAAKFLNYKEFLDQVLHHCRNSYKLEDTSMAKMTKILINPLTHNGFVYRELHDFSRGLVNHLKYMVQQMPAVPDPFEDRYCVCGQQAKILCKQCKCAAYCQDNCQEYFISYHETYCFS